MSKIITYEEFSELATRQSIFAVNIYKQNIETMCVIDIKKSQYQVVVSITGTIKKIIVPRDSAWDSAYWYLFTKEDEAIAALKVLEIYDIENNIMLYNTELEKLEKLKDRKLRSYNQYIKTIKDKEPNEPN